MKVKNLTSGEEVEVEVEIVKVKKLDFKEIKKDSRFEFMWDSSSEGEIYKLVISGTNEVLGLICLVDRPEEGYNFIEISRIETRKDQRGRIKVFDNIAGCLLAFAARESVRKGHAGWLFLVSKTRTALLYENTYGFDNLGSIGTLGVNMCSSDRNSVKLIETYLK